jgi:hypothetical protein
MRIQPEAAVGRLFGPCTCVGAIRILNNFTGKFYANSASEGESRLRKMGSRPKRAGVRLFPLLQSASKRIRNVLDANLRSCSISLCFDM